jgi:hypothetical protein
MFAVGYINPCFLTADPAAWSDMPDLMIIKQTVTALQIVVDDSAL